MEVLVISSKLSGRLTMLTKSLTPSSPHSEDVRNDTDCIIFMCVISVTHKIRCASSIFDVAHGVSYVNLLN